MASIFLYSKIRSYLKNMVRKMYVTDEEDIVLTKQFFDAAQYGNNIHIDSLIENGVNIHADGDKALQIALNYHQVDTFSYLLKLGLTVSSKWEYSFQSHRQGGEQDKHFKMLSYLKQNNIHIPPYFQESLLHACRFNSVNIVYLSIQLKATLSYDNYSPLLGSARLGYLDLVQRLIKDFSLPLHPILNDQIIDPLVLSWVKHYQAESEFKQNLIDNTDYNPQIIAEQAGSLGYFDVITYLFNKYQVSLDSALVAASLNGHLTCVKNILAFHHPNFLDPKTIENAIVQATTHHHLDIIQYLLENYIHADDDLYSDILRRASYYGYLDIIQYIISKDYKPHNITQIFKSAIEGKEVKNKHTNKDNISVIKYFIFNYEKELLKDMYFYINQNLWLKFLFDENNALKSFK